MSTSGHSTNFVMVLELPTVDEPDKWIKAGVAAVCSRSRLFSLKRKTKDVTTLETAKKL